MELLLPLIGFVVVATATPGPNNLLLATSGMQFGVRATIPHLIGIHCGVYMLVLLSGLGLSQLIASEPQVVWALKIFSSVYLLYLAWKILGFRFAGNDGNIAQPLSIAQASLFQFSNPKAWFLTTSGIGIALPVTGSTISAMVILCLALATLGTSCNCLWILLGSGVRRYLAVPRYRRWFNGILAAITVATVAMFWLP